MASLTTGDDGVSPFHQVAFFFGLGKSLDGIYIYKYKYSLS